MVRKRILFFIESLSCGGAEKSLVSLLQMLDYSMVDVTLLLMTDRDDFRSFVPPQVKVIYMAQEHLLPSGLSGRLASLCYSTSWRLMRTMGRHRHLAEVFWRAMGWAYPSLRQAFDVAIAYQQGFPTYYIATKVQAPVKIAWVNTHLGEAGYSRDFNAPVYQQFDHVVAVSEPLRQHLEHDGWIEANRLTTIYDIIAPRLITALSLKPLPVPSAAPALRLTTVARMQPAKNYPLAIDTASLLQSKGVDFVWTFVGDGPQRQEIESLVARHHLEQRVRLVGTQINPYPFIADADIYVQTSRFEGFGITIAEAKVLRRPIVTTNFSVVGDQITDHVNGIITDMNPESLAQAIISLASDPALRQKFSDTLAASSSSLYHTPQLSEFYHIINIQ